MTIITILIICVSLSELLPFIKYFSKKFKNINSIIQLLYSIVKQLYYIVSCKYYRQYRQQKEQEKEARIKSLVREEYNKSFSTTITRIENFI